MEGEGSVPETITEDDRLDLIALLKMRFGEVPPHILSAIAKLRDFSQVDHLIIVAANAAGWEEFVAEIREPGFKIVGQGFDPLNDRGPEAPAGRGDDGGKQA